MPSARPKPGRSAGFSLTETLVALAIAATLAVPLARFVAGTRFNASKVRQEVAIDLMNDNLVERPAPAKWKEGQSNGNSGTLRWRMNVGPIPFSARALSVKTKWGDKGTDPGTQAAPGLPAMEGDNDHKKDSATTPAPENQTAWSLYRVTTFVGAPSGLSRAVDTVRIGPQPDEKEPANAPPR
jgi:prepilin-type N-terminal cleavage/methylation domain-containing protein